MTIVLIALFSLTEKSRRSSEGDLASIPLKTRPALSGGQTYELEAGPLQFLSHFHIYYNF